MKTFQKFVATIATRFKWFDISRLIASVVSFAVVGVAGWWLVRVPPPPPEASLSFASTTVLASVSANDRVGAGVSGAHELNSVAVVGGVTVPQLITVHVAGAVNNPGVYRLRSGSRVNDSVIAAGGATNAANLDVINLATLLNEGEQIYVPKRGEKPHTITSRPRSSGSTTSGRIGDVGSSDAMLININTASVIELEQLPGVGPATAKAIVAYREKFGAFLTLEDLLKVRGIGSAKLSEILPRARVN